MVLFDHCVEKGVQEAKKVLAIYTRMYIFYYLVVMDAYYK